MGGELLTIGGEILTIGGELFTIGGEILTIGGELFTIVHHRIIPGVSLVRNLQSSRFAML